MIEGKREREREHGIVYLYTHCFNYSIELTLSDDN